MADAAYTVTGRKPSPDAGYSGDAALITWTLNTTNTAGTAAQLGAFTDRAIQCVGTWAGATVVLQGSMDGTNWVTLSDPQGTAVSMTSNGLQAVLEATAYVRPSLSGGDGTTSIACMLFAVGR